jgi:hypothetical protein
MGVKLTVSHRNKDIIMLRGINYIKELRRHDHPEIFQLVSILIKKRISLRTYLDLMKMI